MAFSPIIAEATSLAYKGAPSEIQGKLKRVVDVWRDRGIFESPIQSAIESRIEGKLLYEPLTIQCLLNGP
jgi:regulator of Ty1 transposition protein 103